MVDKPGNHDEMPAKETAQLYVVLSPDVAARTQPEVGKYYFIGPIPNNMGLKLYVGAMPWAPYVSIKFCLWHANMESDTWEAVEDSVFIYRTRVEGPRETSFPMHFIFENADRILNGAVSSALDDPEWE